MDMKVRQCLELLDDVDGLVDGGSGNGKPNAVLRDCLVANYDLLHRRLLRHLGCPDQASDCLHDAWLRLGEMPIAATIKNPQAYVFRVARNLAMDQLRANRSWQHTGDADTEIDTVADPSPSPDAIVEARSDVEAVDRAIQRLPRRHQAVLMALRIDELTRHEVASCHGLSLRRVDTVLRQALDYCAEQIDHVVMAGVRSPRRALPQQRMRA